MKNINQKFQFMQLAQLYLLMLQGILLLVKKVNEFSLLIWILLGVASILQVAIVLKAPKKIEMNQLVDRSAMVKLRVLATLPYVLIILGLVMARR